MTYTLENEAEYRSWLARRALARKLVTAPGRAGDAGAPEGSGRGECGPPERPPQPQENRG